MMRRTFNPLNRAAGQVLDAFTRAYIHAAAFTEDSSPGQGEYPEPDPADLDPQFITDAIRDCEAFQQIAGERIADDTEHAGRDFWYTRNGHGCGFWDGDWPEPIATELTQFAKSFGEYEDLVHVGGHADEDQE